MHKILTVSKKAMIGGKAKSLCQLDDLGLTPDFIVLSDCFLSAWDKESAIDSSGLSIFSEKLEQALNYLGKGPLIVRSSAEYEDSEYGSCAGLFLSVKCSNRLNLRSCIRRVWNSRNNSAAAEYMLRKNGKILKRMRMGIIIQKYIKGECGAVIFTGNSNGRQWHYGEYAQGGAEAVVSGANVPHYFFVYNGIIFFSLNSPGLPFYLFWPIIMKLTEKIRGGQPNDMECVMTDERIYILQSRPVSVQPNPFTLNYVVLTDSIFSRWKDSFTLFKTWCLRFSRLLMLPEPKLNISRSEIYVKGSFVSEFFSYIDKWEYEEFYKKSESFEAFGKEIYISALNAMLGKYNNKIDIKDRMSLLLLMYSVFHYTVSYIANNISDRLMSEIGIIDFHKYIDPFVLLCEKEENAKAELMAGNIFARFPKSTIARGMCSWFIMKTRFDSDFRSIRNLLERKISVSSRLADYPLLYSWLKEGKLPSLIPALFFANKIYKDKQKNKKSSDFIVRKNSENPAGSLFFLEGVPANHGTAEGTVFIAGRSASSIPKGSIVIAENLALKEYFPHILKNAAGIIVETRGLISHPAILARELGIPCLTGCERCVSVFKNGDKVRISGNKAYLLERK